MHLDTVAADHGTSPAWDVVLRAATWLGHCFGDPLERVLLVALALVSACLLVVLATREDADAMAARDACIMAAVDDARAFAAVLGDDRPVHYAFAHRSCETR